MDELSVLGRAVAFAACLACGVGALAPLQAQTAFVDDPGTGVPERLSDTGLYARDGSGAIAKDVLSFSPQYPLWSDGADKQRWIRLPPGAAIDASEADAWQLPPGTRLWKEFGHGGRPVETRYIERAGDGSWRFATYVWNDAGTDATLAPRGGVPAFQVGRAPGGRYAIPSRADCLVCHGSAPVPVLGLSALQLSPDRDPLAPGAKSRGPDDVDLDALVARGWVRGLPAELVRTAPRIAAESGVERAALGYLHANCGHCHNTGAQRVPVRLTLAQRAADPQRSREEVLRSSVAAASRWRPSDATDAVVIAPGRAEHSVLAQRMRSRDARVQMPPLGTQRPDPDGVALVLRWIDHELIQPKENLQ